MNNNPTGKNQYTGSLRGKSTAVYHGTSRVFGGAVKPAPEVSGGKAWATTNLRMARYFAGAKGRILVVKPGAGAALLKTTIMGKGTAISSSRRMSVVGSLPTLHKPSRRK